ncbi:DNA primase large subunit [Halocaridina rubra]|uniref:DNA primase large subunit n=1 Tax=Halocaridina rubra TaxID=373956 RepID=A0AAN8WIR7_HALRR
MEFGGRRVRRNRRVEVEMSYPSSLQFYSTPPSGNVSLMEFDEMAVERLKILRTIERLNLSGQIKNSEEWVNKLYDDFSKNKYFIVKTEKISDDKRDEVEAARRQDHISHFIMRLVYCRTEELRRWFISNETDLFRARFQHIAKSKPEQITKFMAQNNLNFTPITNEELNSERENLIKGTHYIAGGDMLEGRTFFKVLFTEALELVKSRKVFLKGGFAYVPDTDLVTLVATSFRAHLSQALAFTNRALPQLDDDERLFKLLQDFDKRYTGNDYSEKKKGQHHVITPDMIDHIATKSFPPCMRQLNDVLRTTHHLKHGGRLTYGLFLKAAGLSLEDALHFWRSHFTKNMELDKFERQYAYGVRYNYGKEGKRTDYTPYSCLKIIMMSIGPGDAHGCPFKHCDTPVLKQRLMAYGIPTQALSEIMDLVSKSHYQIACQRYWEATHNATLETGINHPNQFFEESQKYISGTVPPSQGKATQHLVKGTRAVVYSSQSSHYSSGTSTQSTEDNTQAFSNTKRTELDASDAFDDDDDSALLASYVDTPES